MNAWLFRRDFPVICGCCGNLVTQCYESGHDKACINCRDHFWKCGPKGDKPCDARNLAKGLRGENGSPYEAAQKLGHASDCRWTHTKMGAWPPKGPERDALCTCGYIAECRAAK